MVSSLDLSSLGYELRVIRAKNIELKSNESLFVRCYLFAANNNTRVKLNTHEIQNSQLFWNQIFSLMCFGNKNNFHDMLSKSSMVFELRKRITIPIFGKIRKSVLLGRAEVPWQSVFESKEMEIEKWIFMSVKSGCVSEDVKPPAVQVAMKLVGVPLAEKTVMGRRRWQQRTAECGGECGCSGCGGWDMFSLD